MLRYQGRLCGPNIDNLRPNIITEAHGSRYSIHPDSTKMYHDLKEVYWWEGIVEEFPNCQQVKTEHLKPAGLTQSIEIPT